MTLVLSKKQWQDIYTQIRQEHGSAVVMISWKLRETLGFTVRQHKGYDAVNGHIKYDVRLDFYSQPAMTFFQLKYL
jgi:hypothetical protein